MAKLVDGVIEAGRHSVTLGPNAGEAGELFLRLKAGGQEVTRKVTRLN